MLHIDKQNHSTMYNCLLRYHVYIIYQEHYNFVLNRFVNLLIIL